jgi:broad specificity phosphatase PhoE
VTAVTILMMRHAVHDLVDRTLCGRTEGVGLGETGRSQAAALAARLSKAGLAALYSSPIQRARETAAGIAGACGLEVVTDDALTEIDFGDWTGKPFDELDADSAWRRWNGDRGRERPPAGESMLEAQNRISGFLDGARSRHLGQTIAAVSHGDVIKAAVAHVLGLPLQFHDRFDISPASITTLVAWTGGAKILSLNEVSHG